MLELEEEAGAPGVLFNSSVPIISTAVSVWVSLKFIHHLAGASAGDCLEEILGVALTQVSI